MRRSLLKYIILFVVLLGFLPDKAEAQLVGVWRDTTYTPTQFLDRVIMEYGGDLDNTEFNLARKLAARLGRTTHIVSIKYKTIGPGGNPVVASGVIAYPAEGKIKGVVEVAPVCKDKPSCGSVQLFATEFAPAVLGYITIVPDMIGFGATADMPVLYFDHATAVTVSVDMRKAAAAYLKGVGIELPSTSELFGYSLGAANAFALACHYSGRPWLGVKVSSLFIGGGAYSPLTAVESYAASGKMDYVILPGMVESINHYNHLNVDISKLFKGRVLNDYNDIVSARLDGTKLSKIYGNDLRSYVCDAFFTAEGNADLDKIKNILRTEHLPGKGQRLDPNIYVNLRHAKTDAIVPVSCSDELAATLRPLQKNLRYSRDNKGTHHSEGAKHFYAFLKYLIF